ncbi:OmpL47-type beta-barrel domain-containing protein [Actinoplanes sp. DH11]|uniref:OmpL47-type beta-barrel domain-containing protein n=1 Tax=Actinoplanes sp. DH11 TaxID=2857011 RepID=UPI001E59B592|nr:plastocyanin/azurin family copper-binding protein [Actinoplanes sp. DH11]
MRRLLLILAALLLLAPAAPAAAAQTLTWTADNDVTRFKSAPATAAAGATTIVFENSEATGNTTGMPHTLTFDTSTPGYNHDVTLNILANPFDATGGRHEATVTLTPGKYRYFCAIPGHGTMVGEFTVTGGGGEPDTTAPTVSAQAAGTRNDQGAYVGTATVTVTSSEPGTIEYALDSGAFQPYTGPVAVTAAGEHTMRYRATDAAGNTSAVGSLAFTVVESGPAEDTTPPTARIQLAGTRNSAGAYVGTVTATVSATDTGSGVAGIEYQLDGGTWTAYTSPVVISTPGAHMLHYRASDNAGNTSAEQMSHFTVVAAPEPDTTPPVTAAQVAGDGTATVTVTVTSSEPGVIEYALDSGAWTRYSAPVVVTAAGAHSVKYRATDATGNVAPEKSVTFTVAGSGEDACPGSDIRDTVIIDGFDTGVPNDDTGNGCTVNDLVAENADYADHAAFVRHVEAVTAALVTRGALTKRQQGAIVRAAARSSH